MRLTDFWTKVGHSKAAHGERGSSPSSRLTLAALLRKLGHIFSQKDRQRRRAMALIEQSSLFQHDWYLDHYPDVAASGIDPARHYLDSGWQERRDPGPGFSTTAYLRANADVAALGINPLLHYVEHGHSEGRGTPDYAAPAPMLAPPLETFGPAAPCASFPLAASAPARWRRDRAVGASADEELVVDGYFIGTFGEGASRSDVEAALTLLAQLSGSDETCASLALISPSPRARLLDAWHIGLGRLRTRWGRVDGAGAIVVRVLQHHGDGPMLVGEALVGHDLDVVDARLANAFFPLLFVFAQPDGTILGSRLLVFPSLCRGGLHCPELMVLAQAQPTASVDPVDIGAVSDRLATQLVALGDRAARPLLTTIHVDLEGADGTHPLFQPDFQRWLATIAHISIEPLGATKDGDAEDYLASAVRVTSDGWRAGGAGALVLASDMIPSLTALVAQAGDETRANNVMMVPFVIAGDDFSQPPVLVTVPPNWSVAGLGDAIPAFPRFESAGGAAPAAALGLAAVRMARSRPLGDAELLVPVAASDFALPSIGPPSTWLIWPLGWRDEDLFGTLESLAVQTLAGSIGLLFVGTPSPPVDAIARRLFERVRIVASVDDAVARLDGGLVGYVGQGVVFHDRRTVAVMSAVLDDATVETASVVVVSVERRGNGWAVAPADCGEFAGGDTTISSAEEQAAHALLLWRSSWPVHRPPRDLWMTRTESLARWISQPGVAKGHHRCTAVVSASYGTARPLIEAPLVPPRSDAALGIERLVG